MWVWCPYHNVEGSFDSLYVTYKPEDHEEWKNNRAQFRKKKYKSKNGENENADNENSGSSKKLHINDNLKAALLTHSFLSLAQIDEILEDAKSYSDF